MYISGVCRIFNEISGSLSVLSMFNNKNSWISTVDRIYPNTTQESFIQNQQQNNGNNLTILSDGDDDDFNYKYEVKDKKSTPKSKKSLPRIRNNSISPVSINSSNLDNNDYDIIRDELGHASL